MTIYVHIINQKKLNVDYSFNHKLWDSRYNIRVKHKRQMMNFQVSSIIGLILSTNHTVIRKDSKLNFAQRFEFY